MRPPQIENWALSVLDRVAKQQPVEDSRVELKRDWPEDPNKVARRVAGHCNAGFGTNVLWLIGVDEDQGILGAGKIEVADWYAQVSREFEGLAPTVMDLLIPYDTKTVVALLFDTSRVPFVVRNAKYGLQEGGPVQWEVPWREGTAIRTATRSDLIRLLVPLEELPEVEVQAASVWLRKEAQAFSWTFTAQLYIFSKCERRIVFPIHKCSASLIYGNTGEVSLPQLFILTPQRNKGGELHHLSLTVRTVWSELIVDGPGSFDLRAHGVTETTDGSQSETLTGRLDLLNPASTRSTTAIVCLRRVDSSPSENLLALWEFKPANKTGT